MFNPTGPFFSRIDRYLVPSTAAGAAAHSCVTQGLGTSRDQSDRWWAWLILGCIDHRVEGENHPEISRTSATRQVRSGIRGESHLWEKCPSCGKIRGADW